MILNKSAWMHHLVWHLVLSVVLVNFAMAMAPQEKTQVWNLEGWLIDAGGGPLSGVKVSIYAEREVTSRSFAARSDIFGQLKSIGPKLEVLSTVTSDLKGHYRFVNITHPSVGLVIVDPGGVATYVPNITAQRAIKVASRPQQPPPVEICKGIVLGSDGEPVAGGQVIRVTVDREGRVLPGSGVATITGVNGQFELKLSLANEYLIDLQHPELVLRKALKIDSRFRRRQGSGLVELKADTARSVTGILVDLKGNPIRGVRVGVGVSQTTSYSESVTNEKGEFRIDKVPARGRFRVALRDSNWCMDSGQAKNRERWRYQDGSLRIHDLSERLGNGTNEALKLVAVRTAGARGRVVDAVSKRPIAGARIEAMIKNFSGLSEIVFTDDQGRYELRGLPATKVKIVVWHADYMVHWASSWAKRGENRYGRAPQANLASGNIHEFEDAEMVPALTIAGRVLNTKGIPVPGVKVSYHEPSQGMEGMMQMFFPEKNAVSDAKGLYRVRGVAPQAKVADLNAWKLGLSGRKRVHLKGPKRSDRVQLVIDKVDIIVSEGVRLDWRIRGPDGALLAGAQFVFEIDKADLPEGPENRTRRFRQTSDADGVLKGRFLHAGRYTITLAGIRNPKKSRGNKPSPGPQLVMDPKAVKQVFKESETNVQVVKLIELKAKAPK